MICKLGFYKITTACRRDWRRGVSMKMSCKSQGSRLKAQSSKFKALFLNKAHGSKHKQEDFTKTRVCGFAGAYVTVGSTTWLGGSELMYIGAAEKPPPHLYGDVAKTVTQAGYAWAGYNADNKYPASSLVQFQPSLPFGLASVSHKRPRGHPLTRLYLIIQMWAKENASRRDGWRPEVDDNAWRKTPRRLITYTANMGT